MTKIKEMVTIHCMFMKNKFEPSSKGEYSFNIEKNKVNQNDIILANEYEGKILKVTRINEDHYKYFSFKTGELSNDENMPSKGDIKVITIRK